jgi:uncharacterized protein
MRSMILMRKAFAALTFGLLAFCLILPQMPAYAQQAAGEALRLPAEKLFVVTGQGRFEFDVEIADEPQEQQRGLMYRTDLPPKRGMLFDFGQTRMVTMWMKNTPLPLDMIFIRADGTVAHIAERTTPFSEDIVSSSQEVAFALELNAGVARLIGLKPGDRIEHRLMGK